MSGTHGDHGHHHHEPESALSLRVRALESLLVEKKLVASDAIDRIVAAYEEDIGPHNGAKVVARAWVDPAYRARLLADGTAAEAVATALVEVDRSWEVLRLQPSGGLVVDVSPGPS